MKIGAVILENSMEVTKKKQRKPLKTDLPYGPAIPCQDMYPKKVETLTQKDARTPLFIAPLHTIAKIQKQSKCPPII